MSLKYLDPKFKRTGAHFAYGLILICLFVLPTRVVAQTTFYPAQGLYNGFLDQMNVVECENQNADAVGLTLEVYSSTGNLLSHLPFTVSANGSQHIILNSLLDIRDSFGLYRLSINGGAVTLGDKIHCRTSFYRPGVSGASKPFEYAYALPVRNPQVGDLAGIYNSYDPAGTARVTYNWLSLFNFASSPLSATVDVFDYQGTLVRSVPISNLIPQGRIDIDLGHSSGQVSGLYRIRPNKKDQAYDALVIRYHPDGPGFRFAFPLRAHSGSCGGEALSASTMGNGQTDNWLEIGNANNFEIPVTVEVRDRNGTLLHTERRSIAALGQSHVYLSSIIDPARTGNVGSARVLCDQSTDKLIVQSTFYGKLDSSPGIEWAYSSQALNASAAGADADLLVPLNTYVGMANWLKIFDISGVAQTVEHSTYDQLGGLAALGSDFLASGGSLDIGAHALLGAEKVGSIAVQSSNPDGKFQGEVLRVLPRADGQIGSILALAAIIQQQGVSGIDGTGFRGDPQSLAPYRENLTSDEAAFLLQRTSWGGNAGEVAFARQRGLTAVVNSLTTLVNSAQVDSVAYNWLDGNSNPNLSGTITWEGVRRWWMYQIRYTPNPLRERVSLVLHDLFATSCRVINLNTGQRQRCFEHVQLLRNEAFGNYRQLLKSMTKDYAMLVWLNNNLNKKGSPDENYAREHWELFSTGEPTKEGGRYPVYTDEDVAEAARAFTGWRTITVDGLPTAVFVQDNFDTGVKTLWRGTPYEISGNFNWEDMTDLTLDRRPEAARFFVRRLFVAFVHDHPNDQVLDQLAGILRANNFEILPVLRTILRSEAFFSSAARHQRVKDPITFLIGFLRKSNLHFRTDRMEDWVCDMGFCPTDPNDVNGWPGNKHNEASETDYFLAWAPQYANVVTEIFRRSSDFGGSGVANPNDLSLRLPSPTATAEELVEHLAAILDVPLSEEEKDELVEYANTAWNSANQVQNRPFDPRSTTHVREKVSGLLWLLSQHEHFMTY